MMDRLGVRIGVERGSWEEVEAVGTLTSVSIWVLGASDQRSSKL